MLFNIKDMYISCQNTNKPITCTVKQATEHQKMCSIMSRESSVR